MRISGGIGAAPVTAHWTSDMPISGRTWLNATASRNSKVSISSCVAVPAVIFSTIGWAAATASLNWPARSGSPARAPWTPA